MKLLLPFLLIPSLLFNINAQEIRKIATWNMKWLGTNAGNQLDAIENVVHYADYILKSGATLFALQEIGATHSAAGKPKCFYLDKIVDELNKPVTDSSSMWVYILDEHNKQQRLAFLYKKNMWKLSASKTISPGSSFNYIRKPFLVNVIAVGENAGLSFDFINIHFKAFKDDEAKETRRKNFSDLTNWIQNNILDDDVLIAGDTNIYTGESDVYKSIEIINYKYLYDAERTSVYAELLGERFDRFFSSPGLLNEIESAKNVIGSIFYIDVVKPDEIVWFSHNISDHFAVVLNVDVSAEQ